MIQLQVDNVTKTFGSLRAVDGVSLESRGGEIFALLGPNGAGKTTLIRMIMDITRPDQGSITFDEAPISHELKHRVGYLPEERGLYRKQRVGEVIAYFGRLHGLDREEATRRAHIWLERVGLEEWEKKKVEELSKGMQQKAQLALTLLHDPDLIVLDEPFAGLDPVNTRLIKDFILELRGHGKTILLSTHQMAQVEALADRIFMISHGRRVLYGGLREIKREYSEGALLVNPEVGLEGHPDVLKVQPRAVGLLTKVLLREGVTAGTFLKSLLEQGAPVEHFELAETPLEDIFVKLAQEPVNPEVAS
jgi:ABC-2 type transport system ATP-binding protein